MFDDPNLVADAGLVPVVRLAERARLGELVIAAVRLREGKAADVRGEARFVAESLAAVDQAGCAGMRIVRADSKFYTADVVAACRRRGAYSSLSTGISRRRPRQRLTHAPPCGRPLPSSRR
ncbi:hypothetical protein [Saccharopolyspora pogona]|uniref:hypothetical protein n=1 Tax=Saccharopolyspora pogona TaxID=333966 RepID=UPI001682F039|nr:hypothetical protein [Saccharopolyspora pogona]